MQVLLAHRGFSASGGAERYLERLGRGLATTGCEVTLLSGAQWPAERWDFGCTERIEGLSAESFARAVIQRRRQQPAALLFSTERIPGCDVYRAGGGLHVAWLRRLAAEERRPVAAWFRRLRALHRQTLRLERELFNARPAPLVIANSQLVAGEIASTFDFPTERLHVITNGFDRQDCGPAERAAARAEVARDFEVPRAAPLVLFLGSGFKRKGAQVLVDAFAALGESPAHVVIAGRGALGGRLPARVHLPGPVASPRALLLAADLFVLPTLYDPWSNACAEAAAFGLPVLTTDANGFAEALRAHPAAGEVVPIPRDPDRWRDALARWLGPGVAQAARPAACALAGQHSLDANLRQTLALLRRVEAERR